MVHDTKLKSKKEQREVSETWNAFIHPLEISVRKMTVDKGSASRGMIVMCGEKQIVANVGHFLLHFQKYLKVVTLASKPILRSLSGKAQNVAPLHLALTCKQFWTRYSGPVFAETSFMLHNKEFNPS